METAQKNATKEEREYLPLINNRIERGSLSDMILKKVGNKSQKTDLKQAIFSVYSELADCLEKDRVYGN
jgi:predicted CopG family antitoxin